MTLHSFIRNYFCQLYTVGSLQGCDQVLTHIPSVVTPEINATLLSPISNEEVCTTVFQLGGNKALGPDSFSGLFYQHN